jgi:hypothetical protein
MLKELLAAEERQLRHKGSYSMTHPLGLREDAGHGKPVLLPAPRVTLSDAEVTD